VSTDDQPGGAGLDGLGSLGGLGGGDLSSLMAQAQQMQQQLMAAQEQLARTQVTGSAGGGLVRVTVTGSGEVVGLEIDPSAIDPSDAEGLADVVLAAIRDANRAAAELQQQAMGPLAEGLGGAGGLGLPGL
jgi:nucleoid-associated protein EbfC